LSVGVYNQLADGVVHSESLRQSDNEMFCISNIDELSYRVCVLRPIQPSTPSVQEMSSSLPVVGYKLNESLMWLICYMHRGRGFSRLYMCIMDSWPLPYVL